MGADAHRTIASTGSAAAARSINARQQALDTFTQAERDAWAQRTWRDYQDALDALVGAIATGAFDARGKPVPGEPPPWMERLSELRTTYEQLAANPQRTAAELQRARLGYTPGTVAASGPLPTTTQRASPRRRPRLSSANRIIESIGSAPAAFAIRQRRAAGAARIAETVARYQKENIERLWKSFHDLVETMAAQAALVGGAAIADLAPAMEMMRAAFERQEKRPWLEPEQAARVAEMERSVRLGYTPGPRPRRGPPKVTGHSRLARRATGMGVMH